MGFNSQLTMVGLKPAYGKSSKNNKKIAYLSKCPLFSRSPFLQPQLSDFVSHWNDNCPRNVPISSRHTHTTTQVQFQLCIFLYFLKKPPQNSISFRQSLSLFSRHFLHSLLYPTSGSTRYPR